MSKYTKEDINIFGDEERALNAIGKKCYFGYHIDEILAKANNDSDVEVLEKCNPMLVYPFISTKGFNYRFMIVKKEEPKEYVPFESKEEFIDVWSDIKVKVSEGIGSTLDCFGVWLKYNTDIDDYYSFRAVTEIWNDGVVLGSDNDTTKWSELLEVCQFVDGTPCGKLKE